MKKIIIWQYWEDVPNKKRPKYVDLIFKLNTHQILKINQNNIFKLNIKLIRLNPNSAKLKPLFQKTDFKKLLPQQKADIIRLYLLLVLQINIKNRNKKILY